MHQQANNERELMEWFDKQEQDVKWRINAYVIASRRPMAETLRYLKTIEECGTRLQLVHPGSKQRH